MKATKRLVAFLLATLMIITCVPLGVFAAETNSQTLVYESAIYEDETIASYKQYEAMWKDSTYVKGDVKYTVYFDTENATQTRDVVFYVINWNGERIGTDSDVDIVTDLIKADASVESGNRWAVVVVDFGGNPLAKSPNIEMSLAYLREALPGASKLTVWTDSTHTTTKTVPVHKNHVYVLPAGYRVARDIPYFETDYHASLGTRNYVMKGWNSHIADKIKVYYAYHTGNDKCSFDHVTNANVECIAGAPQEINGNIVKHSAGQLAPKVTRYEDMRKTDGSPLDYVCRLDIIYPSGENVEATPVMVQAATQSPRMTNVGTVGSADYDKDGESSLKVRAMLVGMEFCGYTVAVYDYAYSPMARGDHYGYIDPYGAHYINAAKTSRAAIRCIRYFAEEYGYDDTRIGAAGISKGTPTVGVISTVDNKYVQESDSEKYDIDGDGPGTAVSTRGVWYEGDINAEGIVTTESTTVVQPYMTYEAGYNGKNIDGADVNYNVTRTGEISSEINVAYCAAGDGINRVYRGDESIIVGGTNPTTGKETQHVPMILSCGYYDEYGCWDHWTGIQKRFTEYAENPFLAIGMEDMGHDYPSGIDPMRDYDRYNAYMQFLHSYLKPELYTPQVAWMTPVNGEKNVSVAESIKVQLIKPAESLEAFEAATTIKDKYGNAVEGTWTTNDENTSGLYTFVPTKEYMGGEEYTITVDAPVVAEKTSKTFTVESAGFLRPVADTYVNAANKAGVYGTEETLYIDNQRTYLATFKTSDFEDANKAYLNLDLMGAGNQTLSVYLLDGFEVDESKTNYNNTPSLSEDKLIGTYNVSEGESKLDLLGIAATVKEEYFTLAISGSAHYYEENFESYTKTTTVDEYNNNVADKVETDRTHYYSYADESKITPLKTRRGGGLGTRQIKSHSGEMVFSVSTGSDYTYGGFLKFYNSLNDADVNDIIGKTFKYSVNVKLDGDNSIAEAATTKPKITAGIIRSGNNNFLTSKILQYADLKSNNWLTISGEYTIAAANVAEKITSSDSKRYSYPMFGMNFEHVNVKNSGVYTYLVDDIIVQEVAPTALVSRENTDTVTAYIKAETIDESGVVADTYVSKAQPDIAFGNSDRLLLNGGDNENIMFLTYSSKLVENKTNIQFTIPAEDKASVEAEILLLDGYYVNEETLTYNNMPDLSKAVSLGTYTITGGVNTIEIEDANTDISGAYFTIVFKTSDNLDVVYFKNFEDYDIGYNVECGSNNVTDTVTNASGVAYQYYYGHIDDNNKYIVRKGGAGDTVGKVMADPADSSNKTTDLYLSKSANHTGRFKFFNAISDSEMTAESPLVCQTLRFSAKVKAGNQYTIDNGGWTYAAVMLSAGSESIKDADNKRIQSDKVFISDEWQTVTIDYKVSTADIKVNTKANGNPAWGYPMFTLELGNVVGDTTMIYLVDDITVVKLESDGTVSRLDIASSEGAKTATDTIGIRARNEKDPVADTYISAANKDGVFGFEKTLYADSQRTYLATFKTSDFNITDKGYLLLPLSGSGSQTLSVYLIDGFVVDENATCYNNTPELTDDKLIDTVEALEGEKKINLNTILSGVTDDYFTIAIKGTAHCFEENFDNFTVDKSLKVFNANNTYSDSDYEALKNGACSTENFVWRTGGATPSLYAKADPADSTNKVAYVQSNYTYNRIKWYNSFVKGDKLYFGQEDLGKTFNVSYKVRVNIPSGVVVDKLSISHEMSKGVSNNYYGHKATPLEANTWTTINTSFTVNQSMIDNKSGMFGFMLSSTVLTIDGKTPTDANSNKFKYYFDDIVVSEEAAGEIASLDNNGKTSSIITSKDVIADTYVSKGNPDTCYGNEKVLKLGDKGGDKKALVLSYMNSAIDGNSYVDLMLNNSGDALKDVHVYYVLDYLANETTLTWNTMPEYEENLLGVYDIAAGENQIDLSALKDKLTGEYFTLVLRTENHTFLENFESYDVNYRYYDNTSKDNNQQDPDVSTNIFYHGFIDLAGMSRRGGNLSDRYVIADTDKENNNILKVPTSASSGDGRLKFYNSINYEAITKESDIVGKTLRFSFRAKADVANCNAAKLSTLSLNAGAMTSWTNANIKVINISSSDLQSGWKTYTVDYTVNADDVGKLIKGDSWATGKPVSQNYTSFPMFGINFGDDDTSTGKHSYFIDDVSVVEVVDGEAVGDATFGSREAHSDDISFVSALNDSVTILETTASSATTGDVFSIVDGADTYSLLTVKNGNLVFGDTVLCNESGNAYVLGDKEIKVVAIYDDTKGTVRFAIGDHLAYYKDSDGAVHATYDHLIIGGGISNRAALGSDGIKATKLNHLTTEIIGSQTHTNNNSVRIVSGIDTVYFNEIGFMLESNGLGIEKEIGSTVVYSSIIADNKDVFAKDYGYNLMSALAIKDVKNGGVIKVTPFLRIGTNYVYGETVFYKITTSNGISVSEVDESEFTSPTNANLASVTVDGEPIVGFSADKLSYTVGAADPLNMNIVATAEEPEATVEIAKNENTATITVTAYDGQTKKVYTITAYEKVESSVVNKNGADAIVTYVFDDGDKTTATIVTETLAPKYDSLTGSFALITKNLATLSTIEGVEGDGLLEYEFDENGDYVYTKNDTNWKYWEKLLNKYDDHGFEAVSHTHTHDYIGENDNGGSFEYKNTSGTVFPSDVFPIGNVRKEYYASNQILRALGERALTMVGAGLTAGGAMIDYTDNYRELPQKSGAFIGKRSTYTYPTTPEVMVNNVSDFVDSVENRFNVKSYMVQHYNASSTAPKDTNASNYSKDACLAAGVGYWTDYINKAVEMGGWAAFCFHNIKDDSNTETKGHFVYQSQADAVFKHSDELAKENKVWVANFTDACLYMFERSTAEVNAHIADNGNIVVSLDDKENDEIFTMPLTVKVALPTEKTVAKLGETALNTFTDNGKTYVYVDIVPGNSATLTVE